MKTLVVLAAVLATACALSADQDAWDKFKAVHNKQYANEAEEGFRMKIFKEKLREVEAHNAKYEKGEVSFKMGTNKYSDLLSHEMAETMNGLKMSTEKSKRPVFKATGKKVPDSVDWREEGYVTDIKDQGSCGSCWAFSTTGSLEGQLFKKNGKLVSLSEQNLVDCSSENSGCNGGTMDAAFTYIEKNKGIDTEAAYPYWGFKWLWCRYHANKNAGTDIGYVDVTAGDEDALKEAVATIGPVSIAIDANHNSFMNYASGIFYEESCSSSELDHGVLVVGYGSEDGEDYWIVKNSWGTSWGEKGFVKMARNKSNNCGVASMASYPTV